MLFHPRPLVRFRENTFSTRFGHFVGGGRRLQAPAVLRTTAAIFPIFPFFPIFLSKSFKICHQWILETVPLQLPKQNFILFYFETNHLSTWENNVINRRLYKIFVASVCRYPASRFLVKWKLKYLSKHNKQEARAGDESRGQQLWGQVLQSITNLKNDSCKTRNCTQIRNGVIWGGGKKGWL